MGAGRGGRVQGGMRYEEEDSEAEGSESEESESDDSPQLQQAHSGCVLLCTQSIYYIVLLYIQRGV